MLRAFGIGTIIAVAAWVLLLLVLIALKPELAHAQETIFVRPDTDTTPVREQMRAQYTEASRRLNLCVDSPDPKCIMKLTDKQREAIFLMYLQIELEKQNASTSEEGKSSPR